MRCSSGPPPLAFQIHELQYASSDLLREVHKPSGFSARNVLNKAECH
jgi:hypothetical protein